MGARVLMVDRVREQQLLRAEQQQSEGNALVQGNMPETMPRAVHGAQSSKTDAVVCMRRFLYPASAGPLIASRNRFLA